MSDRDAYEGAREDLLDWKRRALRAEAKVREYDARIVGIGSVAINSISRESHEAAIAAAVAKEREKPYWLIECREGFVGWYALGKRFDCRFFDTNPVHAVRFDTREKAEDLIARLGTSCMTATEHLDIFAIRSQP